MIRIVNVFTQSEATLPMDRELEFRLRSLLESNEEEEELEDYDYDDPLNH